MGSLVEDLNGKRGVSFDCPPICRSLNFAGDLSEEYSDPLEEHITLADLKARRSCMVVRHKQSPRKLVLLDEGGLSAEDDSLADASTRISKRACRWALNHPAAPNVRTLLELPQDYPGGGSS